MITRLFSVHIVAAIWHDLLYNSTKLGAFKRSVYAYDV